MNDFISVAVTAYAAGIACSGGIVWFAKTMPIPDYIKQTLCFFLPIPPACIALVIMLADPLSTNPASVERGNDIITLQTFFIGLVAGPLSALVIMIVKRNKERMRLRAKVWSVGKYQLR